MSKELETIIELAKRAGFKIEENYLPYLNTYPGLAIFGEGDLDDTKDKLLDVCETNAEFKIFDSLCSKMQEINNTTIFIPNLVKKE